MASAQEALHDRIDQLLTAAHPAGESALTGDHEFLRRAHLALTGIIPTPAQARTFVADPSPDKRARLVDQLLASAEFVRWMALRLDVTLMERRAEKHVKTPGWQQYLEESVAANKPWNQLVRELLSYDGADEKTRPVSRWLLEREGDPHALTRDVGRLFLGRDMGCAQCHDHPRIVDYLQRDYYGIEAFFSRTYLFQPDPAKPGFVGEKADGEAVFTSVFTKVGGNTLPRLPGDDEIADQPLAPAELWTVPPNDKDKNVRAIPKFSRRGQLIAALGDGHHPAFRQNIANRLWHMVFGRGLIEPLDLHHSANPASNPALLDLLAESIAAMNFDMKGFVRELALTKAFQRVLDVPEATAEGGRAAIERVAALEQEAKVTAEAAATSIEALNSARKALLDAQREAEPLNAELKKQETAVGVAQKAADAALAEVKKATDALTARLDAQKFLAEAAAKAGAAAATMPDVPELVQAAKTFETKSEQAKGEIGGLEQAAAAKKADADPKVQALADAQQSVTAARSKLDEARRGIALLQTSFDAAGRRKREEETKSRHAARLVSEAKAFIAWADVAAADRRLREAAIRAESALADARQTVDRLNEYVTTGPARIAAIKQAAEAAAPELAKAREAVAQRRPVATALAEAAAKAAEVAAKLTSDAEIKVAAAAIKAKADAITAEVTALDRTCAEAQQKVDSVAKVVPETEAKIEKALTELPAAQEVIPALEADAKIASAEAEPAARARETLSTAWSESFASTALVSLMPEQLCWTAMQATGVLEQQRSQATEEWDKKNPLTDAEKGDPGKQASRAAGIEKLFREKVRPHEDQYVRAFGGATGQPQTEFFATPEQGLYFENAGVLRGWAGVLAGRLAALADPKAVSEELYLSVLTRAPTELETEELSSTLAERPPDKRNEVLTDVVWALVTSVEFRFAH